MKAGDSKLKKIGLELAGGGGKGAYQIEKKGSGEFSASKENLKK